ncbi:type II toxin-antitoxin system death-on-curing family toxin [Thalassovita sp.]|uniref:type II toxin-antitoxin system death-on-curing family toxin n=1 Tax=Thalassovita sp. TaxID=1979401 RepID=UPI002B26A372|nr:type II toxin-antitoxin system death-on-curing family toxin [Thalassovita sp.]
MLRFEPLPNPEETEFLSREDVDFFHEEVLKPGQQRGYKRLDDLLGAIGRPQSAFYYDNGCDLVRVATYYWHGISTSHGYIDGNKRTGFASANNFLLMNGVRFEAPDLDLGPLVEKLFDEQRFELDILEDILRRHCHWA